MRTVTPVPKPQKPPKSAPQGKKAIKRVQPAKKKRRPRVRSIKSLKAEAWKLMSRKIRQQYAVNGYVTCYTCGKVLRWEESQAGHGVAGRGNYVLFLEEIIRPQCSGCNVMAHGRYDVFVPKLIREIGLERYEEIVRQSRLVVKRDREYYLNLIERLKG